jgi:antitoxin (DNA-binding transcriptional repressor) of toxin-antitoxin stability system
MNAKVLSVTDFKARCLELFDRLTDGTVDCIKVTRRGKPVAIVTAAEETKASFQDVIDRMKGTVHVPSGVDIIGPAFDGEINAEKGILRLD